MEITRRWVVGGAAKNSNGKMRGLLLALFIIFQAFLDGDVNHLADLPTHDRTSHTQGTYHHPTNVVGNSTNQF